MISYSQLSSFLFAFVFVFVFVTMAAVNGFVILTPSGTSRSSITNKSTILQTTVSDIIGGAKDLVDGAVEEVENVVKRDKLKRTIVQLGASYDRGFGASPSVRTKVEQVIASLEGLNQETNASRYIDGPVMLEVPSNATTTNATTTEVKSTEKQECSPLTGDWRMIWTTASDVLILGANPFVTVGAIYQVYDPPVVTNIIDLLPRVQNLLPPVMVQGSLLRAQVGTKASSRASSPMRIGLNFESVKLEPVELLGQNVKSVLPPLGFDLPKLFDLPDDVGYFDVTFLDEEMLIIRQNSPGGLFVLAKVEDSDP